jgi:hypothetical protein
MSFIQTIMAVNSYSFLEHAFFLRYTVFRQAGIISKLMHIKILLWSGSHAFSYENAILKEFPVFCHIARRSPLLERWI